MVDLRVPANRAHRLTALDGVRALAVVLVLVEHGFIVVRSRYDLFSWWAPGSAGVRLFFVLSGFLITGILLEARSAAEAAPKGKGRTRIWLMFYARRALRIVPVAYAALIIAWAIGIVAVRAYGPWYFSFLSNMLALFHDDVADSARHYWSIAVEEQFYLVWPLLILWLPRRLLVPMMAFCILGAGMTRWMLIAHGNWGAAHELTPARLDALAAGGLFACRREQLRGRSMLLAGAGALIVALGVMMTTSARGVVIVEWGGILLALALVQTAAQGDSVVARILSWPPLVYLGTISYGIYVVHYFIPESIAIVERHFHVSLHFPQPGLARCLVMSALSVGAAAISWRFLESPINALKRYVPYVARS